MTTSRRSFVTGLIALATAPAIVRASSLMPIKDVYDTRCLVYYNISVDAYSLRVDRYLGTLVRPPARARCTVVPLSFAKEIMGPNNPIFTERPLIGVQKMAFITPPQHVLFERLRSMGINP